jgi:hypothetical protein
MKHIKLLTLCIFFVSVAFEISGQPYYATLPYTQNFDGTWVNKNDTRDVPDSCWLNTPATGNNSWRRQNDGASASWSSPTTGNVSPYGGSGGCANFHSYYTSSSGSLDLFVDLGMGKKELSFEYYNATGSDQLVVLLSTDGGTSFPATLKTLTTTSGWITSVIDLGAAVNHTAVIRFRATGDNSSNDIGVDNVTVKTLFDPKIATVPYCMTFENTWIDRSTYRDAPDSSWILTPSTGNNSWRKQSEGSYADWNSPSTGIVAPTNSSNAADFHSYYTASSGTMDLYIDMSNPGKKILYYYYYNASGTDKLDIQLSTDYGGTWNTLQTLNDQPALSSTCNGFWLFQSVSLGNVVSDSCIIRFKATGDNSTYDIGLDMVCVIEDLPIQYASIPYTENFETGSWTDRFSWKDIPGSCWVNTPAWGNNSWRRQNEGCSADWSSASTGTVTPDGSTGAANFHSYYTASSGDLDLYFKMNQAGTKLLTFNYLNASGTDNLKIYLSTDHGSTFNLLQAFTTEPAICSSNWAKRSVVLGTTTSDSCILRFRGTGDNSTYDLGLDNININVLPTQLYAAIPYTQDFEISWNDKYGQKDVPDAYWISTPAWGNNSWRRQDEGCTASWSSASSGIVTPSGSTGTADFHSYTASTSSTGTMDLYVDLSAAGPKLLTFLYINASGTDQLDVYLSTDGGSSFNNLATFTTQTAWLTKSVNLGTTTSSTCVVRFKGTSDLGMSDIGIDNVNIKVNPFPVYADLPYLQSFESTWIDMYGTHDAPDSSWVNTPYTGSTSWRRQNDGATASWSSVSSGIVTPSGSSGAADFHSYIASSGTSGTFDLYVDFSPVGSKQLTFNYQNSSGTDKLELKMSIDGGTTFGSNLLSLTSPYTWALQTVNLGTSTSSTVVLRFKGTSDAGMNDIGIDNVNICVTPGILNQPVNSNACLGDSAALVITPSTNGDTYQWQLGGVDITGETDSILVFNPVTINDAGTYTCIIENSCGTLLSDAATVTVVTPVSIISQSDNDTVCPGDIITFSISAGGNNPLYQWQKDGININGATTSDLFFNPVTPGDAGLYTCVISNTCSNIVSDTIHFIVNTAVLIIDQITDTTLCESSSIDLFVNTFGTPPILYQWQKGGTDIVGATSSSYLINPAITADAGVYTCTVSNACDTLVTANINLIIGQPLAIDLGPDPVVCADQQATLDAGSGFDQYLWSTGETTQSITIDSTGYGLSSFQIYVDAMNDGCTTSDTVLVTFTICTGVANSIADNALLIYPNPAHDYFYLIFDSETGFDKTIELYNCIGEKIECNISQRQKNAKINISGLPEGLYYVKMILKNKMQTRKLVIN